MVKSLLEHLLQPLQPSHVLVHAGPANLLAPKAIWHGAEPQRPEERVVHGGLAAALRPSRRFGGEEGVDPRIGAGKVAGRRELRTIAFFVEAMKQVEPGEPVLFFGVGPTLHHVFLAAGKASEIHLADYLPANLSELARWIERHADAHDWRPFVRYTLQCEGVASPTERQIREREEITRAKITKLLQVDARHADPLGERNGSRYGTVISAYCADSATGDRATWETFVQHIAGLVRPGGMFITAALRRCRRYLVGGKAFPSADVDENDLRAVLEPQFVCEGGSIEAWDLAEHESQGYTGIVLGWARRSVQAAVGG